MEAVTESTAAVADHGRVMVRSEFAPLRTVAVARSQFRAPDEMSDSEASFLAPEALPILERMLGRDHGDVYPDRQRLWEAERENLCSVFERHGVEVLRPRMLTDTEKAAGGSKGYANFFVRDPWFTIGDIVIEGNLRLPHRRREVLPSRDLLTARALEGRCSYLALPQPAVPDGAPGDLGTGPFLEGGDVLVYDKSVFVGSSGLASNALGIRWLEKLLTPLGYTVETVRLAPNFLHLDCALGLIREGLLVACPDALLDGLPAALRGWERIEISERDGIDLGTNGLPISPEVYVTDPAFRHIGDRIAAHGVTVEYVDFAITRGFGGSFRCTTQPLRRE
ncbi:N-dimethylarginine dimethylaminohydrolase [Rhodococcus sp. OK611]|uniref:dimethylarginine dimethylaminohydrolase family protein n=1 Tax=unclassified Rhodococcus (in: high G+C Gram-positive bacteria) TaxID=192944 RepID=UPI000BDA2CB2|nr:MULTISPECIES: amidinotransferase [unclassified Rhodococcus (in: high G+C Gram-positive bacteria)]PTR37160.1 N-dimethylarginine dimethylaminohydrolase [Rhodococcus sp. OK611]SNX93493.1 N-Dimethylarginine dimethylaminohydrolase [Rhodococcus sp. OK270]